MTKNKRGRRSSGRKTKDSVDSMIVNSHKATGSTTTVVQSDLTMRRQNFNIIQNPPRQLSNQIYWVQLSYDQQLGASATGPTEVNTYWTAGNFPEFSDFTSCFDQYCIYSVTTTFTNMANNTTAQAIRLYTAIDYDSVTAVGKTGIFGFSSFQFTSLAIGGNTSLIRYVKPCLAPQVTSSNVPVPGGIGRAWVDCGYSGIQWYGLRTIIDQWVATATGVVEMSFTAVFGFRNSI